LSTAGGAEVDGAELGGGLTDCDEDPPPQPLELISMPNSSPDAPTRKDSRNPMMASRRDHP